MAQHVLITGASGLVGSYLTNLLLNKGYTVSHLGRKTPKNPIPNVSYFCWDTDNNTINEKAFNNVDAIVHLAGANVADQRWTNAYKKVILSSRLNSTQLLFNYLANNTHNVKTIVAASAIGIYANSENTTVTEDTKPLQPDFLSNVVHEWEQATQQFEKLNIRTTILRIGIVLDPNGGALPKILQTIPFGIGAVIGSGNQFTSWISNHDLCELIIYTLNNLKCSGTYNAVAPNPVTNKELIKEIAITLHKKIFFIATPSFILRIVLGEMAPILSYSCKVSNKKIEQTGFIFQHPTVQQALKAILIK